MLFIVLKEMFSPANLNVQLQILGETVPCKGPIGPKILVESFSNIQVQCHGLFYKFRSFRKFEHPQSEYKIAFQNIFLNQKKIIT